jgi:hypothetical protein
VRRYLDDGSDPPDEGNRSDLVSPLGELLLWYVVPDDEYGTSDGPCPDTLQFRRRDGCVDVTGYIDMMYYEIPQVRWDDSVSELMKGHWKRVMVRPFTAELRCEGEAWSVSPRLPRKCHLHCANFSRLPSSTTSSVTARAKSPLGPTSYRSRTRSRLLWTSNERHALYGVVSGATAWRHIRQRAEYRGV